MMNLTKQDLIENGIINDNGEFLTNLDYQELTGQESGVWMDYEGCGYIACDNFYGCPIVDLDNGKATLVDFLCEEATADEVIDDDDYLGMTFVNKEDRDVLKSNPKGLFFRLTVDYDGTEKTLYFFAPEDWN